MLLSHPCFASDSLGSNSKCGLLLHGGVGDTILSFIDVTEIENMACNYNVNIHIYADDVILYTDFNQISNCLCFFCVFFPVFCVCV